MAKEDAKEGKQVSDTAQGIHPTRSATPPLSGKNRSSKKSKHLQIGGTAVPGAKSTQPKKISSTNNPQQQEIEGSNRTMRRRMQQMGTGPYANEQQQHVKTLQQKRKEKIERMKQRRAAQIAAVKRSLPGGKISTDTRRVYYLVAGMALAIVAVILLFIILRVTSVLH